MGTNLEKGIFAVILICFFISFFNDTIKAQQPPPGDIFSDNFENASANKWLDMKVWGLGVWQIRDGVLVSLDSSHITQQIYSALPKFDHAIVNRDYAVLFRYRPMAGESYAFTIDVRPQGWNNYKFEISKDGTIRILKNLAGKLPRPLFTSVPGQIRFNEWQWVRLEVTGEQPLWLKMKIWQNELADEPDSFNAIASDEQPLAPQNMNFAFTSVQSGGAYTMIDDFNIYAYRIKADAAVRSLVRPNNEKIIEAIFSAADKNERQKFWQDLAALKEAMEGLKQQPTAAFEINDLANLEVELLSIQSSLSDCETPDHFYFYRESIRKNLAQAKLHLIQLKENQQPFHHQLGTFMRGYYSEIDGSLQGYALFAPENYDEQRPFPLVINLHGYDPSFSSWQENLFLPVFMPHATARGRYILANPFGRGNTMYQNIGEQDVLAVLNEVKRLYSIDENRIYLTGGSMGGAGTWWLGLSYPDRFAAIAPIMGPTEFAFWNKPAPAAMPPWRKFIYEKQSALPLAENALNLPVFCHHGVRDDIVPIEQSRQMAKRLTELGYEINFVEHPEAAHGGFPPAMDYEIYDWFENRQRNPNPQKVIYKSASLKHASAYWVSIHRFIDLLKFATIEAEITSPNVVEVKTDNVAEFSLTFSAELFNIAVPLALKINGQLAYQGPIPEARTLTLRAQLAPSQKIVAWSQADSASMGRLKKDATLAGPMVDVYNSGFMLVYGTIGSELESTVNQREAQAFVEQWRSCQHSSCRIKKDVEVTAEDIANFNLLLLGNARSNAIVRKVNQSLLIRFERNSIIVGDKRFSGQDVGLAMIYPNPLNQSKYVMVLGGIHHRGSQQIIKRIGTEFDYLIFDDRTMGINLRQGNLTIDGTPLLCGFFDQNWQLDEAYQWAGDQRLREKIKPRQLAQRSLAEANGAWVYLSDFHPDSVNQWTGVPELDRNFWGHPFQLNGKKFPKGIGVFPNSELLYHLDGQWQHFSAIVSADLNPFSNLKKEQYQGAKIQFGVYGDGDELIVSRVMDVNSEPQEISVSVAGIKRLKLVVRTQDWLPYFAQGGNWIGAKLVR